MRRSPSSLVLDGRHGTTGFIGSFLRPVFPLFRLCRLCRLCRVAPVPRLILRRTRYLFFLKPHGIIPDFFCISTGPDNPVGDFFQCFNPSAHMGRMLARIMAWFQFVIEHERGYFGSHPLSLTQSSLPKERFVSADSNGNDAILQSLSTP